MNGPLTMYKLKPLVHFPDIEITDTMYRMKNMFSSNLCSTSKATEKCILPNILEQVNKLLQKPSAEIEDLKKRQELILKQLTYLKEQMLALREELGNKSNSKSQHCSKEATSPVHQLNRQTPDWSGIVGGELVIHASPEAPPYSLLGVNHLWPDVLRLHVTCHTHSSVLTLPSHLDVFSSLNSTPSPTLRVRLVWKQMGPDCELIISPLNHCPIRGEVNFLRYLFRTICTSDLVTEMKLDSTLDICHRLNHARTLRDKQLMVRALNARLGKAEWLGGDSMSVGDVAAWSAVRAMSGVELSQNMSRWQSRCCAAVGVGAA